MLLLNVCECCEGCNFPICPLTLFLQVMYLNAFMALNAVPMRPNIRPSCLLEILEADLGNALVKDLSIVQ